MNFFKKKFNISYTLGLKQITKSLSEILCIDELPTIPKGHKQFSPISVLSMTRLFNI
jgi:hypothetical protein